MTPNDSQIDVLLRRHAQRDQQTPAGEHLDADALNAFAEGALPAAARSRYVSHLADCAECRKLATALSMHGRNVIGEVPAPAVTTSWWKSLMGFFSVPALRYAAFALLLVTVAGVTWMVWRRSHAPSSDFVAQNQPTPAPVSAVQPNPEPENAQPQQSGQTDQSRVAKAMPQANQPNEKLQTSQPGYAPPPAPKPGATGAVVESDRAMTANSVTPRAEATPSFAPPPPETNEARAREQQNLGGTIPGGPRRNDDRYRSLDRSRAADVAKEEDKVRATPQSDEKKARTETRQAQPFGIAASRARDERAAQKAEDVSDGTPAQRSVGGRKFQRQGNTWVDLKFKSSMSVREVARGSAEFDALDSKLRSIANQLGGEVVVVWKGKAYRIK